MTGKTHTAVSVSIAVTLQPFLITSNPGYIAFSILGAIICDIDSPYSIMGRLSIIFLWPLYVLQYLSKLFCRPLYNIIKHKGLMHWPFFWVIMIPCLCCIYNGIAEILPISISSHVVKYCMYGFLIGVFSHLFLDMLAEGIYAYAPFSYKKISLLRLNTDGIIDHLLFLCALVVILNYLMHL